jgi:nickel-dependent lactate racemase
MVVHKNQLVFVSAGNLAESWNAAVDCSDKHHIIYKSRKFKRALSCAPPMYEDMWTGGKCMYKCEPIVEDGGELIVYAPHITSFSLSHGHIMKKIGYHVRDYYLKQMERFGDIPSATMAVSTYLKGAGTFDGGIETTRIKVTLATGISREECEKAGLAYMAPESVNPEEWKSKEDEGILFVAKGGETLYKEAQI